jgi:hypothetical protein
MIISRTSILSRNISYTIAPDYWYNHLGLESLELEIGIQSTLYNGSQKHLPSMPYPADLEGPPSSTNKSKLLPTSPNLTTIDGPLNSDNDPGRLWEMMRIARM